MSFRTSFNSTIDPILNRVVANDEVIFTPHNSYPYRSDKTVKVLGVFSKEYIESNGMESYAPIFKCDTSSLIGVKHTIGNSIVEFEYKTYKVVGVEPDGTGKTALRLQAQ